jgi:hypothetical protein
MKVKIRKKIAGLFVAFVILTCYLFWGPLFPYSPVKTGYRKIQTPKATLYIKDITARDSVVYDINTVIMQEEKFHDLKYTDDIKIIVLNKEANMKRFLPWLRGSGYSVSLSLINAIYIGPAARKSWDGIEPYLKHELSHMLIGQNTPFKKALKIHRQGWFVEGIAEYFSGHYFYSRAKFLELCGMNQFNFSDLHEKNPLRMSLREVKLYYTYYRLFVEFLIDNYGIEKLQQYLKKYIEDPDDYKNLFSEIYPHDLNEILDKFSSTLND